MALHRLRAAAAAPLSMPGDAESEFEPVPGLQDQQRALEEARKAERKIAHDIQAIRVEGLQAEVVLGRIEERYEAGGTPQQADLDEKAAAEAVIASVEPRISILQGSLLRAEKKTKEAKARVDALKRDEIKRRGKVAAAASEAAKLRAKEERDAWLTECNRLAAIYSETLNVSDKNVDSVLDATAEFATGVRGNVG